MNEKQRPCTLATLGTLEKDINKPDHPSTREENIQTKKD